MINLHSDWFLFLKNGFPWFLPHLLFRWRTTPTNTTSRSSLTRYSSECGYLRYFHESNGMSWEALKKGLGKVRILPVRSFYLHYDAEQCRKSIGWIKSWKENGIENETNSYYKACTRCTTSSTSSAPVTTCRCGRKNYSTLNLYIKAFYNPARFQPSLIFHLMILIMISGGIHRAVWPDWWESESSSAKRPDRLKIIEIILEYKIWSRCLTLFLP